MSPCRTCSTTPNLPKANFELPPAASRTGQKKGSFLHFNLFPFISLFLFQSPRDFRSSRIECAETTRPGRCAQGQETSEFEGQRQSQRKVVCFLSLYFFYIFNSVIAKKPSTARQEYSSLSGVAALFEKQREISSVPANEERVRKPPANFTAVPNEPIKMTLSGLARADNLLSFEQLFFQGKCLGKKKFAARALVRQRERRQPFRFHSSSTAKK